MHDSQLGLAMQGCIRNCEGVRGCLRPSVALRPGLARRTGFEIGMRRYATSKEKSDGGV